MALEPSSPDPLQDLDGPSIYHVTPAPRTIKRTSTTIISPRKNKKLSHTTVVSTPTRSPWRICVVVEAERDSEGEEEAPAKRSRTARTRTMKVPLKGSGSSPLAAGAGAGDVSAQRRRKSTPARRRRRSATATPGGPGRTPAKRTRAGESATPLLEEREPVDIDEGIGSMMDGMGVLEEEEGEGQSDVSLVQLQTRSKAKSTPRKTSSKTPRKPPHKTPAKQPPTVASSSKAPPPPLELEEPERDLRSALSPVNSNRMLSPSPSSRKRRSLSKVSQPPPRPLMDFGPSSQVSNDDDMEGFSMVDTGSLLPDFLNSLSQHRDQSTHQGNDGEDDEAMDLPDFTFMSGGTSYTPYANKKCGPPSAEQEHEELFEDDPVGIESFYGAPPTSTFRSSPPPAFQRLAGNKAKETPVLKPQDSICLQPQLPEQLVGGEAGEGEKPAASSKKRKRDTPDLDSTLVASEGLRNSIGMEDSPRSGRRMSMSMNGEKFGGELDGDEFGEGGYDDGVEDDTDVDDPVDYPVLLPPAHPPVHYSTEQSPSATNGQAKADRKGKGKAEEEPRRKSLSHTPAPPQAASAAGEEEILWALSSPGKSPEKSVRFLGHENSRNSPSVSYNTSGQTPEDRIRLLEASWAAERAAVSAKAREVGALTINDDEIEEDSIEAERIVEDIWQAEAEPRSEATPAKPKTRRMFLDQGDIGEGALLLEREREWQKEREAVKRRALEVGTLTIHDTIGAESHHGEGEGEGEGEEREEEEKEKEKGKEEEGEEEEGEEEEEEEEEEEQEEEEGEQEKQKQEQEQEQEQEEEEEGDSYGAAPGGTTTLLNQDTAAFEESLFHREQQLRVPASGNLFNSSSTPYKRGSSLSDGQGTVSSKSSPPPTSTKAATNRWRNARRLGTRAMTATASIGTTTLPPATAASATVATTATATKSTATATTARERREARAKKRAEAAVAASATQAPPAPVIEAVEEEEGSNILPDDLLTPPLSFTSPTAAACTQVATPPTTNTTASTHPIPSPPSVGLAWEKRHWRFLERLLHNSKTIPPVGSRLTYFVSIDDPSALDSDPDALLADPELSVTTMESGEKALVLEGKEVEAVRRFRERMKAEGSEREQWGVEEVAAKVAALVLAGVRRRRRAEKEERMGKGKGKGKERETARLRRTTRGGSINTRKVVEKPEERVVDKGKGKEKVEQTKGMAGRPERSRGARFGTRLSDWL